MLPTLACAGLVGLGALAIGQAVMRLCGARRWSWLSPAVGVSVMMLIAVPAIYLPGRALTTAVCLAVVALAALVWTASDRAQWPPLPWLLAGAPVAVLALLPFIAAGRFGTLGMSFDNDMAWHLLWAEAYRSAAVDAVHPLVGSYPLGPHALAASLAEGLSIGVDDAFTGLTIALPVLLGWTALGALRNPRAWGPVVTATVVGMPVLIAGFYGQGSFKEVLEAAIVLAVAIALASPPRLGRLRRWVPIALLMAGALSVYSHTGLFWPLALLAAWAGTSAVLRLRATGSARAVTARAREELAPLAIGLATLVVAVAPQIPRIGRFISDTGGATGIPVGDTGNLGGALPVWEALGVWGSPDYRLAGSGLDAFNRVRGSAPLETGLWAAFVFALVVLGVAWSLRRREWMLPAAAVTALAIWLVSDLTQSAYVAAKALVILSPLLLLLAVRPLVERGAEGARVPSWWRLAAPVLAAVLVVKVVGSSGSALTFSRVGSTEHIRELQSLRPLLDGRPTLYLGNDDFTRWIFADVPVSSPLVGFDSLARRPEKPPGGDDRNYDIDWLQSAALDRFAWVVAPRDALGSAFPAAFELARRTAHFDVYRRARPVGPREILPEGEAPAVPLDCAVPEGRAIVRAGGVAAVRGPWVEAPVPVLAPGESATVELPLGAGAWDLVSPYYGQRPVEVTAPGLRATLPANLSRPGPRWPIGRIVVRRPGRIPVTLHATAGWLTPDTALTRVDRVIAAPVGSERIVPIASACGRLVDWYRPARR